MSKLLKGILQGWVGLNEGRNVICMLGQDTRAGCIDTMGECMSVIKVIT